MGISLLKRYTSDKIYKSIKYNLEFLSYRDVSFDKSFFMKK